MGWELEVSYVGGREGDDSEMNGTFGEEEDER
jgi:hypothetical protein